MLTTTKQITINQLVIQHNYNDNHQFRDAFNSTLFLCDGGRNSIDSIEEVKDRLTAERKKRNRRLSTLIKKYNQDMFVQILREYKDDLSYTTAEALYELDIYQDCISEFFYNGPAKLFDFISFCFNQVGLESETYSSHGYSQGDYTYCLTLEDDGITIDKNHVDNILWDAPMYFQLFDKDGDQIDSCGGFWDYESMKEHLPQAFQNESLELYYKDACHC